MSLRQFRKRVASNVGRAIEPVVDDDSPLEKLARRSDEETADDELRRMPERYRCPLVLHYLEERSYQEIADELGITLSAVAGRIKRGRADLRRRLMRRGITLSGFVAIVSSSQPAIASPATAALIQRVVESSMAFAGGDASAPFTSHHLAQLEQVNMTLPIAKLVSLAAVALLVVGFGSYGAVSFVAAQPPRTIADAVQVVQVQPSAADISATTTFGFDTGTDPARTVGSQPGPATAGARDRATIEKIESLLAKGRLEFLYVDVELSDVLKDFQSRLKIPIVIDKYSLEDFGIGTDTPVTFGVNGISPRSALRLILDPHDLTYVIADEVILITTTEEAESRLGTRVYDVGDTGVPNETLIQLITQTVEDDSWDLIGGPGKIVAATPTRLVIAQTQRIHEQVVDLLEQLKRTAK